MRNDNTDYEITLEDDETLVVKRKKLIDIIFVTMLVFLLCIVINVNPIGESKNSGVNVPISVYSKSDIMGNLGSNKQIVLTGDTTVYVLDYGNITLGDGVVENVIPNEIAIMGSTVTDVTIRYSLYGENVLSANDVLYVKDGLDFDVSDISVELSDCSVYAGDNYLYFSEK